MGNWVFCRRCSPNLTEGGQAIGGLGSIGTSGSGFFPINNECPDCNVCFITIYFRTEDVAKLIVGEGNYVSSGSIFATETWVLFNEGDDYSRDDDRPVKCVVTTIENPADPTTNIVTAVSVNDGAFIWTRKSTDELDPDFSVFELTSGVIDVPVCSCGPCVGILTEWHRVGFAWPDPAEGFVADVTLEQVDTDFCEDDFHSPACLGYVNGSTLLPITDGWGFGGTWVYTYNYLGVDDTSCGGAATLLINVGGVNDDCEALSGVFQVGIGLPVCSDRFEWVGCSGDPREAPEAGDFGIVDTAGDCDPATLDDLSYGGDCPSDGTIDCPPEDCPTSFCQWQWNVDTQVWDSLGNNCIEPATCGDPPPDPTITDFPWIQCTCCNIVTPPNPCPFDNPSCGPCTWVYRTSDNDWHNADLDADQCEDVSCSCCGRPAAGTGLFDGEIRAGYCCDTAIAGADCGEP